MQRFAAHLAIEHLSFTLVVEISLDESDQGDADDQRRDELACQSHARQQFYRDVYDHDHAPPFAPCFRGLMPRVREQRSVRSTDWATQGI